MNKKLFYITFFMLFLGFAFNNCDNQTDVDVYFCPEDNCSFHLIQEIEKAKKTLDIAVYTFSITNFTDIADALIEAKKRGVKIRIVMEKQQSANNNTMSYLKARGVTDIRWDGNKKLMHDKFSVIDESVVCTGSYNYTYSAEKENDENLVIIHNKDIAKQYSQEFEELWKQAE